MLYRIHISSTTNVGPSKCSECPNLTPAPLPPAPQERLFDVADLELDGCGSRCGALEVAFAYDYPTRKLTVQVFQARDVPSRDRGGASSAQVSQ